MKKEQISSLQLISVRWWNATAFYAVTLSNALKRAGHIVFVGGTFGSPPVVESEALELPVLSNLQLENKSVCGWVKSYRSLLNFLNGNSIQIINAHRPEDHLMSALVRHKIPNIFLVRTVGDVRSPKKNPINRWLHINATDFFIFSSQANKARYQNVWPIPDSKCAVIYAGVDTNRFAPPDGKSSLRTELRIRDNEIVFGLVGRFSPVKGHSTFLKAAAILVKKYPNCRFIISGKEEEISKKELWNICISHNITEYVKIIGKQNNVAQVIKALDVGVVASLGSEAICRIAAEYMAMGRPVIATDVNVLPEMVIDGKNGYIFPAGSYELLAEKMKIFMQNPETIKSMGRNARADAVDRFGLPVFLKQTEQVYFNLMTNIKGEKS